MTAGFIEQSAVRLGLAGTASTMRKSPHGSNHPGICHHLSSFQPAWRRYKILTAMLSIQETWPPPMSLMVCPMFRVSLLSVLRLRFMFTFLMVRML